MNTRDFHENLKNECKSPKNKYGDRTHKQPRTTPTKVKMLLQISIPRQETEEWEVEQLHLMVAEVVGFTNTENYDRWALNPLAPIFLTSVAKLHSLELYKYNDERGFRLVAEYEGLGTDNTAPLFATIAVASVGTVQNFPTP